MNRSDSLGWAPSREAVMRTSTPETKLVRDGSSVAGNAIDETVNAGLLERIWGTA